MKRNVVTVGSVVIGEGRPKICAPITARTKEEVLAQARRLREPVQMAEWRVDYLDFCAQAKRFDIAEILEIGDKLGALLKDAGIPLLFTCRRSAEGGLFSLDDQTYLALNRAVVQAGFADLIDIEYSIGEEQTRALIREAAGSCHTIVSHHDFEKTENEDALVACMHAMEETGAQIVKLAVMPQRAEDVLVLLSATNRMYHESRVPLITMSMGGLGAVSRVSGETFGSAVTFASAEEASAPGQIPVGEMDQILRSLS